MSVIHKFLFEISTDDQQRLLPVGAKILSVQDQRDLIALWALVDPDADSEVRTFFVVGTGAPFSAENTTHLGTVQDRWFRLASVRAGGQQD